MRTILSAAAIALAASPVVAQPQCAPRPIVVEALAQKFGEHRIGMGIQNGARVVEVFVNAETGSFTVLSTSLAGLSCIVAGGEGWSPDPLPVEGQAL
ncbi:hypothetical protein [Albimonas pacifica]|uniref:Peptidase propeptide and YPEB domain-containing protein n=1 Tax=Albimonas pacifica TaxID=1114924 RepID=A0A1I3LJC4_9RHOB|nr:hypothetical protein [Albimonas pacifica]SFI84854.1 hypothetical protein SAMN05216258_11059 [Albimonas pacifica]